MPNLQRLNTELELLARHVGPHNLQWAPDGGWIMFYDYPLPPNLNKRRSDLLVLVPQNYGVNGVGYRDAFLTPGLKYKTKLGFRPFTGTEHYFNEIPYSHEVGRQAKQLKDQGWAYLCVHAKRWEMHNSILDYLRMLEIQLSNPTKTFA